MVLSNEQMDSIIESAKKEFGEELPDEVIETIRVKYHFILRLSTAAWLLSNDLNNNVIVFIIKSYT